jgi:hypothetical protein
LLLGRCISIRREIINKLVSFVYEGFFVSHKYVDEANFEVIANICQCDDEPKISREP